MSKFKHNSRMKNSLLEHTSNTKSHVFKNSVLQRGFTLLEVLVAALITSFLVTVLTLAFGTAADNWSASTKNHDAFREARAALEIISRDISSLYRGDINNASDPAERISPIYIRCGNAKLKLDTQNSGDCKYYSAMPVTDYGSANIAFLAALPEGAQPNLNAKDVGDICAIGYYVELVNDTVNNRYIQKLYRYVRGSEETYGIIEDFTSKTRKPLYSDYPLFSTGYGNSRLPEADPVSGGYLANSDDNQDEPIAVNVVKFDIRPFYYDNQFKERSDTTGWPEASDYSSDLYIPDYIDVSLRVTSNEVAKRLSDLTKTSNDATHWRGESAESVDTLIGDTTDLKDYDDDKEVKTFTTRIYLK